jgi:hypothetical protein
MAAAFLAIPYAAAAPVVASPSAAAPKAPAFVAAAPVAAAPTATCLADAPPMLLLELCAPRLMFVWLLLLLMLLP